MTDESKTQTTPQRPQESRTPSGGTSGSGKPGSGNTGGGNTGGGKASNAPAAGSTFADPVRREIGDQPDETTRRTDRPKADDKSDRGGDGDTSSDSPSM